MKSLFTLVCAYIVMNIGFSQTISRSHLGTLHSVNKVEGFAIASSNALVSNQSSVAILSTPFVNITQENIQPTLIVFPNPAADIVNCKFSDESKVKHIQVRNIEGREVANFTFNTFKVESFSSGIYFLEITNEFGVSAVVKLNIQKFK